MAEYIEREALLKRLCNACDGWCENTNCDCVNCKSEHRCDFVIEISESPAADVAPVVHGRWEQFECGWRDDYWRCSACGYEFTTLDGEHPQENGINYCPNCGAKMDGEKDV